MQPRRSNLSLFRSVTRYVPAAKGDPRENRLTEVTSAVLERVQPVAMAVCRYLAEAAPQEAAAEATAALGLMRDEARVEVRTQRGTRSGGFVDLELRAGAGPPSRDALLWVEVKHGAGVHYATDPRTGRPRPQLEAYLQDIEEVPAGARLVVLVAPRASMPDYRAREVAAITWQEVAVLIASWRDSAALTDRDRFLIEEYCRYLREEQLMDPGEPLTEHHAAVLAAQPGTEEVLGELVTLADERVRELWGQPTTTYEKYKPVRGAQPGASGPWGTVYFDWGFGPEEARQEQSRGGQAFYAGATMEGAQTDMAWLALCESKGFEYEPAEKPRNYHDRIRRYLYPDELLAQATLSEQAEMLGDFVLETFQLLADDPPPPAGDVTT